MKKFIAMALVATLAFGSSVMVFAADAPEPVAATPEVVAPVAVVAPVVEVVVEEVVEVVAPVNVPFTGVVTNFYTPAGELVANYITLPGNEALTTTMHLLVNDKYTDMTINRSTDIVATTVAPLLITANVEESLTAAKIEYTLNTANILDTKLATVVIGTYYIEKATNKTITAEAHAALVAAETVAEGETAAVEAEVVEVVMLPLRAVAEALGFKVDWNDGKVMVSKGDAKAFLETGSTNYVDSVGDALELEAPVNIDGTLFVPQDFFTKVIYVAEHELVAVLEATASAVEEAPVVEEVEIEEVEEEEIEEVEEEAEVAPVQ